MAFCQLDAVTNAHLVTASITLHYVTWLTFVIEFIQVRS